ALLLDDAQDLFLADDEVLRAVQLDFLSGVLAEEDRVARLDVERRDLAVLLDAALAHGNDLALLGLFLGGVRNDDAADLLFGFLEAFDNDAVVQWSELRRHTVLSLREARPDAPGEPGRTAVS